ncbi:MAG: GAF domain-containing protein [Rhodospirillales bacterium]|nr:MAG: GAF domain-containing protein [Rhodospirillales bacterium]
MTGTLGTPVPTRTAGAATDESAGVSLDVRLADRTRELDELTRQHAATVEIIDIIARSTSGLQPVLDAVVGAAVRHCGADDATLFLREGTESFGAAHEGPLPSGLGTRQQIEGSHLSLHIYRDGRTIHAPDTEALDPVDFAAVIAVARQRGVRALVAAPIRRAGEVIGYLLLRRREVGAFTARQIAMLETLASQAGVAVANAGVITELREALDQQTATAGILEAISSSPTDAQPVFEAIAQSAFRLLNGWSVLVWRYDGERMRIIASHGGVPGTDVASVHAALGEPRPEDLAYPGDAILKRVILQIADVEAAGVPESVREVARARGWRANIAVPMLSDGAPIGIITVSRKVPGAFVEREIGLLQTFAAQAVIAIENVRLFTELRESLARQTAMAEVLAAINANPGELAPVFDAILEKAHRLCGSAIGNLSLYDGARLRRAAFRGMSSETSAMVAEPRRISDLHRRLVRGERFVHVADLDARGRTAD